jgi:hypothetical protein
MRTIKQHLHPGQALVTLLIYILIIITISTAAVILLVTNTTAGTKLQEGTVAYYAAESGVENALLRVLRDPTYTGESNLQIGDATADIVVTPGSPTTIVSTGRAGTFIRKIRVVADYIDGYYTVSSWEEIQ